MGSALRPQKRSRKISGTADELNQNDLISRLPVEILLIILDKLPMEDAIATSLVSRTWRDLWKLISNVDFSYRWVQVTGKEIYPSVTHFVRLHLAPKIKRFSVSLRCRKRMVPPVQSWVTFAAKKHAEELYINLSDRDDARFKNTYRHLCFPIPVLSFSSLMKLTLKSVRLDVDSFPDCKSLRELYLEMLELPNNEILGITEKLPALRVLALVKCNMNLELSVKISPNCDLWKLIIDDDFMVFNKKNGIFIDAPKLGRIELLPGMTRRRYRIGRMGVCTELRLSLGMMFGKVGASRVTSNGLLNSCFQRNFLNILKKFRTARVLELCSWCIQVLSILKVRNENDLLFESTHLVLNTGLRVWELPGIALLLRACPNLENLVININDQAEELAFNAAFLRKYAFKPEFFWKNQEASFAGCLRQLAVVEVRISQDNFFEATNDKGIKKQLFSQNVIRGYSAEAELLKFLVRKSINLAKLIFTTKRQKFRICLKEI